MRPLTASARTLTITAAAGLAVTGLAACSQSPTAPTTSPTATSSSSGSANNSLCSTDAILAVLPTGSTMVKYQCEFVGGAQYAAVRVNPGPTVFFLKTSGSNWGDVIPGEEFCGTANAGLPQALLDFCSGVSPAPTPTKSKASKSPSSSVTPTSTPTESPS